MKIEGACHPVISVCPFNSSHSFWPISQFFIVLMACMVLRNQPIYWLHLSPRLAWFIILFSCDDIFSHRIIIYFQDLVYCILSGQNNAVIGKYLVSAVTNTITYVKYLIFNLNFYFILLIYCLFIFLNL